MWSEPEERYQSASSIGDNILSSDEMICALLKIARVSDPLDL